MHTVWFRFYGELNRFLRADRRARRFRCLLRAPSSVKEAIESLGVPQRDVDVIVVNGRPVEIAFPLSDGDKVAVYPRFRSIDVGDLPRAGGSGT